MAETIHRAKIYLSCHSSDRKEVARLAAFLEDLGFEPAGLWSAAHKSHRPGTMKPNSPREADFFVACLSKKSFKRKSPVPREMEQARAIAAAKPPEAHYFSIIRLTDCRIPREWRGMQIIDFLESNGWENLANRIKAGLRSQGIPFVPPIRSRPRNDLSTFEAARTIRLKELFHKEWNPTAKSVAHRYSREGKNTERVVIDTATGLMWQRYPSSKFMEAREAREHVKLLNQLRWGDYPDWRLPTLEEAMAAMEKIVDRDVFLNPVFFDPTPWILTADQYEGQAWLVNYKLGMCSLGQVVTGMCVRAVRNLSP